MLKAVLAIISFFLLQSCSKEETVYNFSFILQDGLTNTVDTKHNLYRRRYVNKSDAVVALNFTTNDMALIRSFYLKTNLINLPDLYEPESYCQESAFAFMTLTIFYNNRQQVLRIDDCDRYSLFDQCKTNDAQKLIDLIREISASKSHIRKLPKSNVLYL